MLTTHTTADRLSSTDLLDIWNRGFAGYFVDNTMDEARLAKHLRWSAIDLALSPILIVDDEPAGFSLAGVDERAEGRCAWIGGFGIAPEHRRKGLAGRLMAEQNRLLDTAGIRETRLEVIDVNPARRVYAAAGFREIRRLVSFQGVPSAGAPNAAAARPRPLADWEDLHAALRRRAEPTFRRDRPVVRRMLADIPTAELLAVPADGDVRALALAVPGPDRVGLLDARAADTLAAGDLVAGLGAVYPGRPLRIIDEPEDGPLAKALAEAGLLPFLSQFEMMRTA